MALKVRLHRQARADLKSIHEYLLAQADKGAAERVRAHVREKIMRLADFPNIGVATSHPSIRIVPPTRYPYRLYYAIIAEEVVILHLRHTSRQLPDLDDFA